MSAKADLILELFTQRQDGSLARTLAKWTGGKLAEEMPRYVQDLGPGGKFEYVSKALGYYPVPILARLRRKGRVVAKWQFGLDGR